jgi:hypothetical protein
MSTVSRSFLRLTALAIPALALINITACSDVPGQNVEGAGGSAAGTGGVASGGGTAAGGTNSGGTTGNSGGTTGNSGGTAGNSGGAAGNSGGTTSGGGSGDSGGATGNTGGAASGGGDGAGGAPPGAGGGPISIEDCVLPDLPPVADLPRNEKLPSPFVFFDGTPVTTKAQWECRRREIQHMAATYIYGPYPFEPDETTGTVSGNNISITCTEGGNTETFTATVGSGSGDVLTINMGSGILPSGKSLSFGSGFAGKIKNLFGFSDTMNNNVATGWMVDRVIEVLEQNPDSGFDPTKLAVSGCSGCGKGAFLVGVFSRIPMTIIVESGGGGAANLRQAEWFRHGEGDAIYQCDDAKPQSIDNLEETGICGPWVGAVAQPIRSNPDLVYHLPFDQHLLLATMAPRYLVHFSNDHGVNSWCHLGGTCEALSAWAAAPVWNALGVPENMAFELYSGGHCGVGDTGIAAAMYDRAFNGNTSGDTGGVSIMDSRLQQPQGEWEDMWIDWDMNTVLQ